MKNLISIKLCIVLTMLGSIIFACQKENSSNPDSASADSKKHKMLTAPTAAIDTTKPATITPASGSNIPGLVTYFWDNVGTYPAVVWTTSGGTSYNTPTLPNTLGTPLNNGQPSGSGGWEANCCYNNNINTISTAVERYAGHPSLHFILNPFSPAIPQGMDDSGIGGQGAANYRTEILLQPFHYAYPVPSEIWLSWSYYFPTLNSVFDPYVDPNYPSSDNSAEGLIHQLHVGDGSPVVQLWMHASWGNEIVLTILSGDANNPAEFSTGAIGGKYPLVAGQWMDFVEHVVWGTDGNGVYQLWCTVGGVTTQLFNHTGPNTFSNPEDGSSPYGGTPKFGIYHWFWHSTSPANAQASVNAGCNQLEEYLGPVTMICRNPGNYDANGYNDVYPVK